MAFLELHTEFPHLKDKVVIITGASSGIGLATAKLFLKNGAKVVIADLVAPTGLEISTPSYWNYHHTDVTKWFSLTDLFSATFSRYGRIDIVFANAGVGEVEDMLADEWDDKQELKEPKYTVLDINLKGVLSCFKLAAHYFAKNPEGSLGGNFVMTGSTASYLNEPIPVYQAAKHGLLGFMRALRDSAPKFHVSINMVCPWMTESALMTSELRTILNRHEIPINDAQSVARAVAYVCTQDWNGRSLFVGGNQFMELEEGLLITRPQWLGETFEALWKKAEKVEYFKSPSGW